MHLAARIIVMTNNEFRRVASMCDAPSKITICFRGADQRHFRSKQVPSATCNRFLYVGRRSYEKGFDILEAATDILAEKAPSLSFTFAGDFEIGTRGNRSYVGRIDYADLPSLYSGHDALVLCSRSEGFPQVIMEAMSCGLPCILTRSLFRHDFVDGENCMLVETAPEAVADAIFKLHENHLLYHKLVTNARAHASALFSEEENANRYRRVLLAKDDQPNQSS